MFVESGSKLENLREHTQTQGERANYDTETFVNCGTYTVTLCTLMYKCLRLETRMF